MSKSYSRETVLYTRAFKTRMDYPEVIKLFENAFNIMSKGLPPKVISIQNQDFENTGSVNQYHAQKILQDYLDYYGWTVSVAEDRIICEIKV